MTTRSGDGWEGDLGGSCPVQGYGTVDGHGWYFRARGASWSFDIGKGSGSDICADNWATLWRTYGDWGTWPEAGYMEDDEAWRLVEESIAAFRSGAPSKEGGWDTVREMAVGGA
jgi:hypothetical protein